MTQDWIIDVLRDLQIFAGDNNLKRLADQLDDTIQIAAMDMSVPETRADNLETRPGTHGSSSTELCRPT